MLTAEEARRIWRYDAGTGHLFWRVKVSDKTIVGARAGSAASYGYWQLKYKGRGYRAARVAWLIVTGKWPDPQVDHINGRRSDDRFCNLRESTQQQNMFNRVVQKHNRAGLKGVWTLADGRYRAYITLNGHSKYLGTFTDAAAAKQARDSAALELHGKFARA